MSTFRERLEQKWYQAWGEDLEPQARVAHKNVDPAWIAGARAALLLAAEEIALEVCAGRFVQRPDGSHERSPLQTAFRYEYAEFLRARAEELK